MLNARFIAGAVCFPLGCCCAFITAQAQDAVAPVPDADLPPAATRQVDFVADLKPLFEERCFGCHGETKSESGLRADSRDFLLKGGDHGPAIVISNSAASIMIQVLADVHPDIMGMPRKKDDFTAEQIGLVRAWIDQGAVWQGGAVTKYVANTNHWAFKRPNRPDVPPLEDSHWGSNAIDNFILMALKSASLSPSAEADKTILLRRLSLDLIGLPPTPAEVDAFLADHSPDAYARQVERLLASPHYGEKWGRFWLDAARYADSDGFEKDKPRNVWFYRDWVVAALNADLPYDQFIIKQLAGDLLPEATQDDIVATGFLRNSMINEEGGADPEQFRMEAMFDRMDAIGKSVLGLTIQCAQCHNHKFDPISQEEYYRLFAFLNNDHEAQRIVYTPAQQMEVANLAREINDIESGLRHRTPDWEARMVAWEESVASNQPVWTVIHPVVEDITTGGQKYLPQPDGSFLAQGYAVAKHGAHFWLTNDLQNVSAFRLELLTDPNLPCNGPGRSLKGVCALTEFTVDATAVGATNKTRLVFDQVTADFAQPVTPLGTEHYDKTTNNRVVGPVSFSNDDNEDTAWGIDAGPGLRNQDRVAVFHCATNAGFNGGTVWDIRIIQRHGGWSGDLHMNNNLGRFRLSVTTHSGPVVADTVPKRVRDILALPRDQRSPRQVATVFSYWRTTVPEFAAANAQIAELQSRWPEGETQLALMASDEPRETHLLKRGDFLKPGNVVGAGVPAILHPLPPDADGSRLTLARWLVSTNSPTTARSFVNRVWQSYFGTGLLDTPEDFGTRAAPPSHPELLDWLACEFMDSGWDIKHLHRLIVTSAAYRQSSTVTPELYERDPYNRMLARGPRFRVEGETVRDIALAASGLLNPELGGHSIFPPAPDFLFQPPASYGPKDWPESAGAERYRRSLYIFRFRSVPYPLLQTFDAPNGDFSCVRRLRSNTPLQALVALNEPTFMECARALARKTLEEGGDSDADKVSYAFRRALSRPPTRSEQAELLSLIARQQGHISEGWVSANELATGTDQPPAGLPAHATPTQLAAYTVLSRVLLNLDETITKE